MPFSLLVNPKAHGGTSGRTVDRLAARLAEAGIEATLIVGKSRDHLQRTAVSAMHGGDEVLGIVGGDGTNMAVVDALLKNAGDRPLPSLALIPAGRGNSMAKDLELDSIDSAIEALKRGRTRPVDVGKFSAKGFEGYFLNCVGVGFVTDVDTTASHFPFLGDLSYVLGVLYRTITLKPRPFRLEIDGRVFEEPMCFIEVMNSRKTGGEMVMAPQARIDDGLLDVVWVDAIPRRTLLATFPRLFKGTHVEHPKVHVLRGKTVTIGSAVPEELLPDGDHIGTTPVTFTVLPGRVRYLW